MIFTIKKIRHLTGFLLPLNLIPTKSYSKTMKIIVHNFSMIFSISLRNIFEVTSDAGSFYKPV